MHPVELDLQVGDAGALPLAGFEFQQEGPAVGLDAAQLVELGVEAGGDHAAVAQHRRGLRRDGAGEQVQRHLGRGEFFQHPHQQRRLGCAEGGAQLGEAGQAVAQGRQIPRPCAAQRDPGGDALHVRHPAQHPPHRLDRALAQLADRHVAVGRCGAVAQRVVQGVAQPARAHAGGAAVEQREQRGRRLAAQGLGDLEVAAGGGVEAQEGAVTLGGEGGDVGQRLALGGAGVVEQRRGGGQGHRHLVGPEAGQVAGAEVGGEQAPGGLGVELPVGQPAQAGGELLEQRQAQAVGDQHLGRAQALELGGELGRVAFEHAEVAIGEVEPRQAQHAAVQVEGQQRRVGLVVEQRRVGEGARRDDARHRALHRPLGGARVAHLLGDHHRFAQLDEARQVLLHRVVGHAGHLDRLACGRAARGEGDVHQPRGLLGVLEEQLVEVAHAVEEEGVGVVLLDA